jgi:hypothetical protein
VSATIAQKQWLINFEKENPNRGGNKGDKGIEWLGKQWQKQFKFRQTPGKTMVKKALRDKDKLLSVDPRTAKTKKHDKGGDYPEVENSMLGWFRQVSHSMLPAQSSVVSRC